MSPPTTDDAFTYDSPSGKKEYMEAICLELVVDIDIPDNGNISAESWWEILHAICDLFRIEHPENTSSMNKPKLTKKIATILNFEYVDSYVGAKNGVVSEEYMKEVWKIIMDFGTGNGTEGSWEDKGNYGAITRKKPKSRTAKTIITQMANEEIRIPNYQRANTMWNSAKQQKLVDSMLRNIPMPTIVLGQIEDQEWMHLVDGQQRLTNLEKFINGNFAWNAGGTSMNKTFEELQPWMRKRIEEYEFVVETVKVPDVTTLAHIYERYNTSGKALSEPQVRVALFHHNSVLHHCLLAMAGGPIPKDHFTEVDLKMLGRQASNIRRMLPKIGQPAENERERMTQPTEKTYDLLCRLAGYTLYDSNIGRAEQPTSKKAVRQVLGQYDGTQESATRCYSIAVEIAQTMEKVDRVFGDCAWRKFRAVVDSNDPNLTDWVIGPLNGWAAQIQYAGMWEFRTQERLMSSNREQLRDEWLTHYKKNMDGQRQNSKSLWDAQKKWTKKLGKLLVQWAVQDLQNADSERGRFLREEAETMLAFDEGTRKAVLSERKRRFPKHEYEFLKNCIQERLEWSNENA